MRALNMLMALLMCLAFFAGKTMKILVSPDAVQYVRISRDANRTSEIPALPADWSLLDHVLEEEWNFSLPNPTDNIRCDNEDSFQGPILPLK